MTSIYHNDAEHAAGIRAMCQALALLGRASRSMSWCRCAAFQPSLVRSFAADLNGSLLADGDTLQFLNEPTETWFRSRFRPEGEELRLFVRRLLPLASGSGYVAASLPQLMWESGDFDELVRLALTGEALPEGNDIERQQVAQQRLQFALKAALRQRAYLPAARLALRAGAQGSGHSRLLRLLRENSDLAGTFLDPQTIEDLVATRDLAGGWPNSNLLHEGALLSFAPSQQDYARSRLRSAIEWTVAWVNAPREEHERNGVTAERHRGDRDRAPQRGRRRRRGGIPPAMAADAPRREASRDHRSPAGPARPGRGDQGSPADAGSVRARAARRGVIGRAGRPHPGPAGTGAMRGNAPRPRRAGRPAGSHGLQQHDAPDILHAVCWVVALGTRHGLLARPEAVSILAPYLPARLPAWAGSWWSADSGSVIKGLALLACLRGEAFDVDALAPAEVAEARQRPGGDSREVAEFTANVKPFASWAELWVRVMLGDATDADAELQARGRGNAQRSFRLPDPAHVH